MTAPRVYRHMTWEEIADAARADIPIAIPVGATEQHGRHLPVCTDWVLPENVLSEAGRARDLVVGPFIPFGYRSRPGSGGGQHFPGTVSLRATTFMSMLEDVLSELKRTGFRNIMLYNWHYENAGFVYEPAYLVSEQNPELKIVVVEDVFPEFTAERQQLIWPGEFPGLALEHAAVIETSLWMHFDPSAVRHDRMAPDQPQRVVNHDVVPIDTRMSTASGSLSSPVEATPEKGRLLTEWLVDRLVDVLDEEFPAPNRAAADRNGERSRA
ncbi:creatininase [Mycobacterium sp. ACS1612]|uniref:creatininase n=1 Tax=Mycobacterium sp. ACS1612 TaxID=1834117 RepID=UPI0007FE47D0|nr:creatininase [Mycobacterium sp. ACS1612]OBF29409.1 creatininase [Mycobacterium sp. ACS1612]